MILITVLRHLFAIAVLPFTVTVLIPIWIARNNHTTFSIAKSPGELLVRFAGAALLTIGLALFIASLRRFATEGKGTLAPWDPPKHLVVRGPYRYVRNPMISGVIFILCAEALILRSVPHGWWAVTFFLANLTWIPLWEEPWLRDRFGDPYREYCRHVRRFVPRLRPWQPDQR